MKLASIILACVTCFGLQAELFFTPQMISKHLETYTDKEIQLLEKDLAVVRSICLDDTRNTDTRFYLATAGGPGARKTTILEKFVAAHPEYQGGVYLDPDPRTLKFMVHTYYAQSLSPLVISQTKDYKEVIKNAYDKWRYGSNYIVLTLFEEAIAAGRSVIYGTTSTGAHTPNFFAKLKENDYQIVLLLCSCPDDLRYEAVEYRNNTVRFYQSSPEDAVAKGKFFPQRMGAYFAYADLMYFYWSDDLFSPERLAAVWRGGKLEVHDAQAMQRFVDKYEADRVALAAEGQIIPSFNSFLLN
ncbi:MAG: zeta toxin family protein [Verrucomicrobiota bacterium]|nr:zeta toxin family protein [Verrucomicrobiota bacterium]